MFQYGVISRNEINSEPVVNLTQTYRPTSIKLNIAANQRLISPYQPPAVVVLRCVTRILNNR